MISVNLLPWRKALRLKRWSYFYVVFLVLILVAIVVAAGWHFILWQRVNFIKKQTSIVKGQLISFEQKSPANNRSQQQIILSINKLAKLEQKRNALVQVLKTLHNGVMANAQLTQILITNNGSKVLGKTDSMFGITQLIKSFAQANYCSIPLIQEINQQADEYNFTLLLRCGDFQ